MTITTSYISKLTFAKTATLLLSASMVTACSSGDERGPANPRIAEIETTIDRGGDITIKRSEFIYASDRLIEIRYIENGANEGSMEFAWDKGKVATVVSADAEGDRAETTWSYLKSRPTSVTYTVPSYSTVERKFEYDDTRNGREKQVTTVSSRVGETTTETQYQYFRYNEQDLLEEVDNIEDDNSLVEEFRYDAEQRLDRATRYRNNNHLSTFNFSYAVDGRLDEITSSDNDRYSLSYDDAGRLIETVHSGSASGEVVTTRYTYASGSMAGFSQAPLLPYGQLIDLQGQTFGKVAFMHLQLQAPGDIARAPSGGGGGGGDGGGGGGGGGGSGGGGGGGGGTADCSIYTAETSCDTCLYDSCCDSLEQCNGSLACNNYYDCELTCEDYECVDACRYAHPTGANEMDSFRDCAASYCGSDCDL